MKRKYSEAAHAKAARRRLEQMHDDEAPEVLDWFEQWARTPKQQDESNNNQRSQE
jgi:hypothetical protein